MSASYAAGCRDHLMSAVSESRVSLCQRDRIHRVTKTIFGFNKFTNGDGEECLSASYIAVAAIA